MTIWQTFWLVMMMGTIEKRVVESVADQIRRQLPHAECEVCSHRTATLQTELLDDGSTCVRVVTSCARECELNV